MKPFPFQFTDGYPLAVATPPRERLALRHDYPLGHRSRVVRVCGGTETTVFGPDLLHVAVKQYERLRRRAGVA